MEVLRLTRRLPGRPAEVYAMWTVPDLMSRWLFASDDGTLVAVEADAVDGGLWSILELRDGQEIDHFGRYLVVDPPHRVSFTLQVPRHFAEETRIEVAIAEHEGGSLLEFEQVGIEPAKTRSFWQQMLDRLSRVMHGAGDP